MDKKDPQNRCFYNFKGPLCGYLGQATWCNGSYDRCKNLGRHERFPAFQRERDGYINGRTTGVENYYFPKEPEIHGNQHFWETFRKIKRYMKDVHNFFKSLSVQTIKENIKSRSRMNGLYKIILSVDEIYKKTDADKINISFDYMSGLTIKIKKGKLTMNYKITKEELRLCIVPQEAFVNTIIKKFNERRN